VLDARLTGGRAAEVAAAANYKAQVTRAFPEAQAAMLQLQDQRDRVTAAQEAWQSHQVVREMRRAKYVAGLTNLAVTPDVCRQQNNAADALVQARRTALAGRVQVQRALGASMQPAASTAGLPAVQASPQSFAFIASARKSISSRTFDATCLRVG
jgi:outer membrane protein TolC